MSRRFLSGLLLLLLLAPPAFAGEKTRWLHVRVEDGSEDGETVRINVPASLINGVLPMITEHQKGNPARFRINDEEIDRAELLKVLEQLRQAPEGVEVIVEKDGGKAWFTRKGDKLQIRVIEDEGQKSETRILLPFKLAEALTASEKVDLAKAIESLGPEDGEILIVDGDDKTSVRVWMDHKSGGD
jgi:hypothetical protein